MIAEIKKMYIFGNVKKTIFEIKLYNGFRKTIPQNLSFSKATLKKALFCHILLTPCNSSS